MTRQLDTFGLEWEVIETDRGTGLVCPQEFCDARILLNLKHVHRCAGKRMSSRTVTCPACECRALLPREYQS